ncbi:MAG: hypothetical protein WCA16_07450 [Candidatus Sulfotelmatobacter sp.]
MKIKITCSICNQPIESGWNRRIESGWNRRRDEDGKAVHTVCYLMGITGALKQAPPPSAGSVAQKESGRDGFARLTGMAAGKPGDLSCSEGVSPFKRIVGFMPTVLIIIALMGFTYMLMGSR